MNELPTQRHPQGKQRYRSVVEGVALANEFYSSRMSMSEFARQRGVSVRMVTYWSSRARQLAAATASDLVQIAEIDAKGGITPVSQGMPALPAPAPAPAPAPVPVPMATPAPLPVSGPTMIEVRLPNGVRLGVGAGFSPVALAQVIACLGGRSC